MPATVFTIAERHREHENQLASVGDFTLVADGARDVEGVLADPACTLYCLDPAKQQAIFVETPPSVELHDFPFLYQVQFQHARRVIAIAYDELLVREDAPPAPGIAFLYSVGRCGSTLIGRALNHLPDVVTLAEPDALLYCAEPTPGRDAAELLRTCTRLLCKSGPRKNATSYVIKMRHHGTQLAPALQQVFPASRALFVYRSAIEVVTSALRAFHTLSPTDRDPIPGLTRTWLSTMQQYLTAYRGGVSIRALRYEDLIRARQQLFPAICRFLGFPEPDFAEYEAIFAADSQAGSNLSREKLSRNSIREFGSPQELAEKVRETLAGEPELNRPDVILPGTLTHDER